MARFGGTLGTHNAPMAAQLPPTMPMAPGLLVPGFAYTGTATYLGPYAAGELLGYPFGDQNPIHIAHVGDLLHVSADIASQLASSDEQWWEFH